MGSTHIPIKERAFSASSSQATFLDTTLDALGKTREAYKALYIHLPFCVRRCGYCDFDTEAIPANSSFIDDYIEDLCLQIRRKGHDGQLGAIESIYVGGGTPSYVGSSRLSMLFYTLALSLRLEPDVECSMEANPESLTPAMVRDIWALGVNRLSLGVQSFDDVVLHHLGRAHNAEKARDAIRMARERFDNISIDLMFGIPEQSAASVESSVCEAVALGVNHISIYPLIIEPDTAFDRAVREKRMPYPDEDNAADHMKRAEVILNQAGFSRYEVASYAKPGFSCRHNMAYWRGVSYLGLGRSAASMTQSTTRRIRSKDGCITDDLDNGQKIAEDLMLGMRMTYGISDEQLVQSAQVLPTVYEVFQRLQEEGLVRHENARWLPTERGWLCGNELYGALYDLAPDQC